MTNMILTNITLYKTIVQIAVLHPLFIEVPMYLNNLYVNENFHATMAWPVPMGGGYHYMKLEGDFNDSLSGYGTHTGGTMGMDYSFNNIDDISSISIPFAMFIAFSCVRESPGASSSI